MGLLLELARSNWREDEPRPETDEGYLPQVTELAFRALDVATMSLKEWCYLTPVEHEALSHARRQLTALEACTKALADSGPMGRAYLLAEFDDGAALEAAVLDAKVKELSG